MNNINSNLPPNFLLEITKIPGEPDKVCAYAINHYANFLQYPDSTVSQIAYAMVGNLTEYFNISNSTSYQFTEFLPHLSDMANFMDSKNSKGMDVQSTARVKSFYSAYEKLLLECADHLERKEKIPNSGLIKDMVATRDILSPKYHFKNDPQAFYKQVYRTILEFMERIDELHEQNPEYDFIEVSEEKHRSIEKRQTISLVDDEELYIPEKDFISYALEIKNIPEIYRYLVELSESVGGKENTLEYLKEIQKTSKFDDIEQLPFAKLLSNQFKKQNLKEFRDSLEQDFVNYISQNPEVFKDYQTRPREEFLYINKSQIRPEYLDYLKIISSIDEALECGTTSVNLNSDFYPNATTKNMLDTKFQLFKIDQELKYRGRINAIKTIDLETFDRDFEQAKKIAHYAKCSKDYMKFPKSSGYQSFHITIKTPFGHYEKQFRTEAQHNHAEFGGASHSKSYKPYEKESFHRLKVPTPLMPARDENNEIITPISLTPIPFQEAVREYYHKDFCYFADGISWEVFKSIHSRDLDFALLSLSQSSGKMIERVNNHFGFLKKLTRKILPKPPEDPSGFEGR